MLLEHFLIHFMIKVPPMSAGKSDASCATSQPTTSSQVASSSSTEGENRPRVVVLMCLSAISFALMGAMVKLSGDLPLFEKVFVRNLVSLVVAVVMVRMAGARLLGHWHHQPLLLARSLIGLGGVMSFFYAIDHLLLADATILNKLSPFFVMLFAGMFLAECVGRLAAGRHADCLRGGDSGHQAAAGVRRGRCGGTVSGAGRIGLGHVGRCCLHTDSGAARA